MLKRISIVVDPWRCKVHSAAIKEELEVELRRRKRFRVLVQLCGGSRPHLEIPTPHLVEPRPWCGDHPGACEPGWPRPVSDLLEGGELIALADFVNGVLDRLKVTATAGSTVFQIRRGRLRRTAYGMKEGRRHPDWDRDGTDGDYADFIGREAPPSWYPPGTPGQPGWWLPE